MFSLLSACKVGHGSQSPEGSGAAKKPMRSLREADRSRMPQARCKLANVILKAMDNGQKHRRLRVRAYAA